MPPNSYATRLAITICICALLAACGADTERFQKRAVDARAHETLSEHSRVFAKGVVKVTDQVHVAIGYGLANAIMIEGDDGLIIVDTMETSEEAAAVLAEFRKISAKPIRAIIYTHNHVDHVMGADVFAEEEDVAIYAHASTAHYVGRLLNKMRPVITMRSMRMFGNFLDEKGMVNCGIGPRQGIGPGSTLGYRPPTITFQDRLTDEVAGIRFELVHAPGETNDQIFMWLPDQSVLLPGDNYYSVFPNLYTIRGTPFRSLEQWYRSVDTMRDLHPHYMVPSHTRPVIGADNIERVLTDYRDAIQFVHDQSIRGINMGMTPDELTQYVKLPPHLADAPHLQPLYGKVSWSARAMFCGNLGWFDGDAASLQPLSRREQAQLMADVAGGEDNLAAHAEKALAEGRYQAALQLTGHLVQLAPENRKAKEVRVKALMALGEREENPNARHYYLTEALEIRDAFVANPVILPTPEFLAKMPMEGFFELMAVNLDPVASRDLEQRVCIQFSDIDRAFSIHIRRGVAEIRPRTLAEAAQMNFEIHAVADSAVWKEMLAKLRNPLLAMAGFEYKKGNTVAMVRFMKMFQPPKPKLPYEPYGQERAN